MNPRYRILVTSLVAAMSVATLAWPQSQPLPPDKNSQETKPMKSGGKGSAPIAQVSPQDKKQGNVEQRKVDGKDPTAPSPKLKELLYPDKAGKIAGPNAPPRIPVVILRGRVVSKSQPAVALLEIDGRLYSVTKGSNLSGGNLTTLKVLEINGDEVRLEVSPLREVISLK